MKRVVVRYRTKPELAEENQQLVEAVFEELHQKEPEGVGYATFRLGNSGNFVHVAFIDTPDGSNPLAETASFAEFQSALDDRCIEQPDPQEATLVGSYKLLAE